MSISIVFDMDDTLYLERDYVRSGLHAVDIWAQREIGVRGLADAAQALIAAGRRDKLFDGALAALGHAWDAALIDRMVGVYRAHTPQIALAPDAHDFLTRNRHHGLALVSDGFRVAQHGKVAALGLAGYGMDPIICTDDWGREYWKPHRRAFETVAVAHAGRSTRFIYVADNPAKDFLAPRALGWATVQIDRADAIHPRTPPSQAHRADMHIRSLDELDADRVAALVDIIAEKAGTP